MAIPGSCLECGSSVPNWRHFRGCSQDVAEERAAEEPSPLLAVDADGYVWRVYGDQWSMARTNPDNSPIPQPVTYYAPIQEAEVDAQVVTTTEVVTFKYDDEGRVISQTTETVATSTGPVTR